MSVTTEDLIEATHNRTGLARNQLLLMAAKSAAVRHIAQGEHATNFVLKGGTLLTHVYNSPRQSIQDADYVHLDRETVDVEALEDALLGRPDGITFEPVFGYEAHREQFRGTVGFSFDDIHIQRGKPLKVTVSVRQGEWLDPPKAPLIYHDPLLASDSFFTVQGLTINELASEKILGWCSKDLPKHLVDLAYIGREHATAVAHETVADLVKAKFKVEGKKKRYRDLGITSPSHLPAHFTSRSRLDTLLHAIGLSDLFFSIAEQHRAAPDTLANPTNVERLALTFWEPTLELLRSAS